MNASLQALKDMGPVRLAMMLGVIAVMVALLSFVSMRLTSPVLTPLYTSLSIGDSGQIVSELEKKGVPYEIRAGGTQVLAPSDQVLRLRLSLAQQGLPSGGSLVGYEIFDKSEALGTSNFVLNMNMLRALEGELSRTIASLSQVESARVHLVVPKQELFAKDKALPTASVVLKMRGSNELTKPEIASISHLVATAVPGLKPSSITIVDNRGKMLAKGGDSDAESLAASNADEYRIAYENRTKNTIENLLEKSVGMGKVKAEVSADIDFDRIVTNSEKYDPEGQVARSIQGTEEKETSTEKGSDGNVSVANNLPAGQAAGGQGGANKQTTRTDETTNFEISKTVQSHTKETGTVKRLSVAVLLDGTYTKDADGNPKYAPRTEEELKQYTTLVKSAIGFDEKRGDKVELVNMQFTDATDLAGKVDSPLAWLTNDLAGIIQTLVLGGVAILALLLVVRPLVTRIADFQPKAIASGAEMPALAGPAVMGRLTDQSGVARAALPEEPDETLISIERIQGRVKSASVKKINEIVDSHPDETINVLRRWIYKES